jgi:hypothetical protein
VQDVKERIVIEEVLSHPYIVLHFMRKMREWEKIRFFEKVAKITRTNVEKEYDQKRGIIGMNRDVWIHAIIWLENVWSGRVMVGMCEEFCKLMQIPQFVHACEGSLFLLLYMYCM